MRRPDQRTGSFAARVWLIAAAALVGRLAYLYLARGWQLLGDGVAYRIEAERVLDGRMPGTLHPPAWAVVMAVPGLFGLHDLRYQQAMTALVGSALVVMIGLAARKMFDARVGLIAAALAAVYPNLWLYEREVLSEPLAMLSVAVLLWLVLWFRSAPSALRAAGLGFAVGVSSLIRSELIAMAAVVVLPLVLGRSQVRWMVRVQWLGPAAICCLLPLAPWFAYNQTRYERPVLLSTGMGPAMRQGNCSQTYEGELLAYFKFGCILFEQVPDDPSVSDGILRSRAIDFMADRPGRSLVVAAAREGRVFNLYRPFQQARLETERGSALWVTRAGLVGYWLLLPFAVAGVVIARRRGIAVYPLLAPPLIVFLAVLPTIGSVRYRAPAEVALVVLAAVALGHLSRRWTFRHRRPSEALTPYSVDS